MSYTLETLNKGRTKNFGFYSADTTKVRLSEDLPPISLEQFCQFSTQILLEAYTNSAPDIKANLREIFLQAKQRVKHLKTRNSPQAFPSEAKTTRLIPIPGVGIEITEVGYSEQLTRELLETQAAGREISPELGERLAAAHVEAYGYKPTNRQQNPFKFTSGVIKIENFYEVDPIEFACFSRQIMSGGTCGWDVSGVPQCAASAIDTLVNETSGK